MVELNYQYACIVTSGLCDKETVAKLRFTYIDGIRTSDFGFLHSKCSCFRTNITLFVTKSSQSAGHTKHICITINNNKEHTMAPLFISPARTLQPTSSIYAQIRLAPKMCCTILQHQPHCTHTWLTIHTSCHRGTGFTTCPTLLDGGYYVHSSHQLRPHIVPGRYCPQCDGEVYCLNEKRMVRRMERKVKIGFAGPAKGARGWEVGCCVM